MVASQSDLLIVIGTYSEVQTPFASLFRLFTVESYPVCRAPSFTRFAGNVCSRGEGPKLSFGIPFSARPLQSNPDSLAVKGRPFFFPVSLPVASLTTSGGKDGVRFSGTVGEGFSFEFPSRPSNLKPERGGARGLPDDCFRGAETRAISSG